MQRKLDSKRLTTLLIVSCALLVIGSPAWAHGDEDHSRDKASAAATSKVATTGSDAGEARRVLSGEVTSAQRLPDGSLSVPKAVQRQLGIRTVLAQAGPLAATVELNGRVMADANAGGRVQAIQGGRIEAGPRGLPVLGQKVVKGQVLLWLRPGIGSVERGNQRAALAEIDAQLALATARAARYAQLEGAVPQKDIDASRIELGALNQRRAAVASGLGEAESLVAPAAGVISAVNVVNGQVVEPRETLLEIVDPARLSVEALAYDPALVDGIQSASVPLSGGALELQFMGGGRQLREQALPLLFRVKSQNAPVAVGQPVKVIAKTSRTVAGVAVPEAAVARNSAGETVVWVHVAPERFVQRRVSAQPLDALAYTVFDTETTGLEPSKGDEIIQIGAARIVNNRLLRHEIFNQLVDPERPLRPEGIPIHGITPEMVAGQPPIGQVLPAFHAFARDTVLVAHNAAFDMRFLELKQRSTGIVFDQPVLDTLLLSAVVHPQQESHRLEAIAERLGVNVLGRHTAVGDAMVTAEIFLKLIPLLAERGIHTLGQAREAAQKTYYARVSY